MRDYTLSHVTDEILLHDLGLLVTQDRLTTASLLAHIGEVDSRRLYALAGYDSMHSYCVGELRLSEDAALRRIQAARAAREFPALFHALAEGRLHLTAVCLLAPHLTSGNVEELVGLAEHRRKVEIQELLARRFPVVGLPGFVRTLPALELEHALAHVGGEVISAESVPAHAGESTCAPAEHAPAHVENSSTLVERFLLQVTIGRETREKLRHAQALLSHALPSGDLAKVLDRALDSLIRQLEKRKIGAGRENASPIRARGRSRYLQAAVRRAVWDRDGGRCTFVGVDGHRCNATTLLEFDHVDPFARGGDATVEGLRLRCRTHNQLEAERAFGVEFMAEKREASRTARRARVRSDAAKAHTAAIEVQARTDAALNEQILDVASGLRTLGIRARDAQRVAESTRSLQVLTLEDRMREALKMVAPRCIPTYAPDGSKVMT